MLYYLHYFEIETIIVQHFLLLIWKKHKLVCCYFQISENHTSNYTFIWWVYLWKWFVLSLPYRVVFAVATEDSVVLYDSQQTLPFAYLANIHYHTLSDLTWFVAGVWDLYLYITECVYIMSPETQWEWQVLVMSLLLRVFFCLSQYWAKCSIDTMIVLSASKNKNTK